MMAIYSMMFILTILIASIGFAIGIPFLIQRYMLKNKFTGTGKWILSILKYSLIIGGISFIIGFVGPIIFAPEANQGPLLGLFITGPVGILIGAAIGSYLGFEKNK